MSKRDWNCGNNVPQVVGNPLAILAQQFDMRPNPTTGVITGAVYGSNQILCGNGAAATINVVRVDALSGRSASSASWKPGRNTP
jgi:hypothetical protein